MRSVLVTRPKPAGDDFANRLRREGFNVYLSPLAEYIEEACEIGPLGQYQALVFTSAEAVRVFTKRTADRAITVFAVGEATAKESSRLGFQKVWQAEGSSDDVLRLIRQKKNDLQLKRVLHVCGEETAQDIAAELINDGISVEKKIVYRAKYVDSLPSDIRKAITAGNISVVTLFSPKAAAHFVKLMQRRDLRGAVEKIEAICLSARVAEELKDMSFSSVRIARRPHSDAVIETLKEAAVAQDTMPDLMADPVIAAFGGLRPLASRLGLPASTVQGWKKRGNIPGQRSEEIFRAAFQDGIDPGIFTPGNFTKDTGKPMQETTDTNTAAATAAAQERRNNADRRRAQMPYNGTNQRSGVDRRAFIAHQKSVIRQEQTTFAIRTVVGAGLLLACVAAVIFVMFAPEVREMQYNSRRVGEMEEQMRLMNERLAEVQKSGSRQTAANETMSDKLDKIQEIATKPPETITVKEYITDNRLESYMLALSKARALKSTPQGKDALSASLNRLVQALPPTGATEADLIAAVDLVRKQDPVLNDILQGVDMKNVDTGVLLLALEQFNARLKSEQPFSADLSLLKKLSLGNTDFDKIVANIMPYADSGIASLGTLQGKFKESAMDIAMARLQGEDLSTQEQVLKRLDSFVKMRKVGDIEGNAVEAVVARAELLVSQSNITGALQELSGLSGAPLKAATPWMYQAQGNVASKDIASAILTSFATGISAGTDIPVGQVNSIFSSVFGDINSGPAFTSNLPAFKAK